MNRKVKSPKERLTIFQRISTYIILLPVVFALGLGSGYLIWERNTDSSETGGFRFEVSTDDDPALGPEDAPITIVEFSDYQCPYCKQWHDQVFERLLTNYPGQIRFVYRDYPLPGHAEALPAAEAANCAGEQGAYWLFHSALFSGKYTLSSGAYQQYALELGLDVEAFNECLNSHRYRDEVLADYQYGNDLGVSGTPFFFINGLPINGALPYEYFRQIIDKELAGLTR